jgi:hypothetical protein
LQKQHLLHQNHCLHQTKLSTEFPKYRKPLSNGESLVLPAATDIVETLPGESLAKELKIPRTDSIAGRRMSNTSEKLCDHLIDQLKTSHSALQVDEGIDVVKGKVVSVL